MILFIKREKLNLWSSTDLLSSERLLDSAFSEIGGAIAPETGRSSTSVIREVEGEERPIEGPTCWVEPLCEDLGSWNDSLNSAWFVGGVTGRSLC